MPAAVRAKLHFLRNLGNFENVEVGLEIEDEQRPGESFQEALDRVWNKVEQTVEAKVKEIDEESGRVNVTRGTYGHNKG
jgi:hypothetical protein